MIAHLINQLITEVFVEQLGYSGSVNYYIRNIHISCCPCTNYYISNNYISCCLSDDIFSPQCEKAVKKKKQLDLI